MAVVDLDRPPAWFAARQAADHMTAGQARAFAGTSGPVKLLTDPISAGYIQNPISVYYCYSGSSSGAGGDAAGKDAAPVAGGAEPRLERCIAEVTNTPWNERVTFVFNPAGAAVAKALHVSPFMDMHNTWHLEAPSPGERLRLVVRASHPVYGDYFHADLVARRCGSSSSGSSSSSGGGSCSGGSSSGAAGELNEEAGLGRLWAYGFMPHRVAFLIYWQAVNLLAKGVPFYAPPGKEYQRLLIAERSSSAAAAATEAAANGNGSSNGNGSGSSNGAAAPATVSACGGAPGGLCPVAAWSRGAGGHGHPRNAVDGRHFVWRQAPAWPWREA
ncbi:hypothetical protein HXX76_005195 [Chlamydomonas incerta]|uniref:DUF1365-domain-containing protein n=1 Tax=Chlamydomonas incerta TaxID=51695 RepID=A0A835T919_CHLIN|nr:hypothetical protein HXX76_005195 [Chlamydomonas incerta]|eukprot:KAG2438648.1 hypothetical protein HXX76_005195 [Chlamydomonas incerta]